MNRISTLLVAGAAVPIMSLAVSVETTPASPIPVAHSAFAGGNTKEPKSAAFIVYRVERRPAGELIVTFENGETWQQIAPDVTIELTRGETVVIRRRGGSFVLESSTGLSTRIKRVR